MGHRILIVDDYVSMRRTVRALLHQLGYRSMVEAEDGATAILRLEGGDIDLVIADWDMSPLDGPGMLRLMREDPKLRHIPVIMMSGEVTPEHLHLAKRHGVSAFLKKPFTGADLHRRLALVLKHAA